VRSWGHRLDGATVLLTGTYQLRSEVSRRLLTALPPALMITGDSWDNPLVGYLAQEVARDELGQEAVLDRLLDLLLVATLRAWFAESAGDPPGWYRAAGDPLIGPALRSLNDAPAHPWTVAELAVGCGMSRAAFARRFTDLVGEPPMRYLSSWRLTLAADLLREPGATLSSIARQVGYGSPFALSAAFKRLRGVSPDEYRRGLAA
jgi:AraC-like DNA-binding protein